MKKTLPIILIAITVTLVPSPQAYSQASTSGLVAYYPLDGNGLDAVGTNHAAGTNGIRWTAGKQGACAGFDGNCYMEIPHSATLEPSNITAAAWFNLNSNLTGYGRILSKDAGGGGNRSYFIQSYRDTSTTCLIKWGIFSPSGADWIVSTNCQIQPGQWHHVAGTYDGHTSCLFVDGALVAAQIFEGPRFREGTSSLNVGALGQYEYFNGWVDEVRIYNRALSGSEIQSLAAMGPALALQMYAGVTINGIIGETYVIEYATQLNSHVWNTVTNITLQHTPFTFIDWNSPGNTARFYRAVLQNQ
ncbi:MAG: LamG domain-containing protein [Verrucomicrobiae bacterium]|nr:LamG domain-containing protein [Verrucomicrobiae bacterium]